MANSLPNFPTFDIDTDATSLGILWKKWTQRLENLFVALAIENKKRQRAMLLHYGGKDIHNIYCTLTPIEERNEDYAVAKERLSTYFEPKVNKTFEVYNFRKMKQDEQESIDKFVTRLREAAERCDFHDADREIKDQVVFSCVSDKLRRKALQDDITLPDLLKHARTLELSDKQAAVMEHNSEFEVNKISRPGKYSNRSRDTKSKNKCFSCGEDWPHSNGRMNCPAFGHTCQKCQKRNHFEKLCKSKEFKYENKDAKDTELKVKFVQGLSSGESEDEYVYGIENVNSVEDTKNSVSLKINQIQCTFQVDSGSSVNIINEKEFRRFHGVKLKQPGTRLYGYNSKIPLPVIGCFDAEIESKTQFDYARFYVVKGDRRVNNLLGIDSSMKLGILKIVKEVTPGDSCKITRNEQVDQLLHEYDSMFHGIGKLKNVKVKLHVDESIKPIAQKHRRVPFHLRKKVDAELQRLLQAGVIEHVEEPTGWVSPVVIAPKKDSPDIRLCVDMTQPNKAIKRVRHVIPTLDELRCDLNGTSIFSKIDLNKGYHQLELDEESRSITTFSTHAGLARFCRLNFGTSSATEIFHEEIRKLLQGISGVINIHDDILISGKNQEEHNLALKQTLEVLHKAGLTLNKKKCIFSKQEVKFFGLIFNSQGIMPDPEKVLALKAADPPSNKKELRSFLGMTNFSALFIRNYSSLTAKLRELLLDRTKWKWEAEHQQAFNLLKNQLESNCLLNYFDAELNTEVICDASPTGVSAILTQYDDETKQKKVIAYASRSLTETEQRYGQIEREAVAILFGCTKFRLYLLGKHFDVITDHKPLKVMFNNPRSQAPFRVERIRLKLQGFDFSVDYISGPKNPSDYISRHSLSATKDDLKESHDLEAHVHMVIQAIDDGVAISTQDVKLAIDEDVTSKMLKNAVVSGCLDTKRYPGLKTFQKVFKELSVVNGLILKGTRLYIPKKLRNKVVTASHDGHQGIVKTKQFLRSKVWYPGMDKDVEALVKECLPCLAAIEANTREPLQMSKLPDGPWENISTDFHGPLPSGHYLLVVIDQYSRFPVVEIVKSTSAEAAIPVYDKIFGEFGIPLHVKSDNGSPFNSKAFANFAQYSGFKHCPITPEYPQANGLVEKFNQMLEKVLATAYVENKNWKQELFKFLRSYRATPHLTTRKAPAELLFCKRPFRTRLPDFNIKYNDAEVHIMDGRNKEKMKYYADKKPYVKICPIKVGDWVIVKKRRKTKASPHYDPVPYNVIARKGNMITAKRSNHQITRNSSFFKVVRHTDNLTDGLNTDSDLDLPHNADLDIVANEDEHVRLDNEENVTEEDNGAIIANEAVHVEDNANENENIRRSNRIKRPPPRLDDYERS